MNRKISTLMRLLLVPVLAMAMAACDDNPVFEKEGDCTPKVQFVFKKHRQALHQIPGRETDVFYSTVGTVHLFVFDAETGEPVTEIFEHTDNLKSASELKLGSGTDRCYMNVDLDPGRYRLVAWCGLGADDSSNAFRLEDATRGGYSHCGVKTHSPGRPVSDARYDDLYHGTVREVVISPDGSGDAQIIPVELTKNTNEINVWVQHTTQTFENGDYEVVYTDANGTMHFDDNSMVKNDRLEYRAHTSSLLTSDAEYNGSQVKTGALVAHLSTARLMETHSADARLEVRDRQGNTVFSVPFIKYVLQMQTFVNSGSSKADERDYQYYLDCEDTYNCTFYLTGDKEQDGLWTPARIIINNWVLVPNQHDSL